MAITVVNEEDTSYAELTTPRSSGSFDVLVDDLIVIIGHLRLEDTTLGNPTNSGTAFTWTLHQTAKDGTGNQVYLWSARAIAAQSMTVTLTQSAATRVWGFNRVTLRGTGGAGASAKTSAAGSGIPSLALTTTRPGSAIIFSINDDAAVDASASRVYLTDAGTVTELNYVRVATSETIYHAINIGTIGIGAHTVGLSAPTGQDYHIVALEILLPHTKRPGFGAHMSGGLAT